MRLLPWREMACVVAILLVTLTSGLIIVATMSLAVSRSQVGKWAQTAAFALAGALANCSMALAALMLYLGDGRSVALLLPPALVLVAA